MTPFTSDTIWPFVNAAINGKSAAASGSQNHPEHNVCTCRSAIGGLRDRKTICVIGYAHFTTKNVRKVLVERMAIQPR
jgi:hypothetical protein